MTVPEFMSNPDALAKTVAADTSKANARLAYTVVSYWSAVTGLALVTPVALFVNTLQVSPTPSDDKLTWVWERNHPALGFISKLTGTIAGDSVRWTMSVTGKNLNDFVWYTGTSTLTAKSGNWIFRDTTGTAVLKFSYDKVEEAVGSLKIEVIKVADPGYGSSMEWKSAGDAKSFIAIDNNLTDDTKIPTTYTISWSKLNENGSIVMSNSEGTHSFCWDTKANGHVNMICQ
jgi:hypothetical protein